MSWKVLRNNKETDEKTYQDLSTAKMKASMTYPSKTPAIIKKGVSIHPSVEIVIKEI